MTKTELLETIRNGENSGVEFKRDDIDTRGLAEEIVALANLQGGKVLLGIEDDGTVSGIQRPDLELWVMNVCCDLIRPEIIPYFEIIHDVDAGKSVAVVQVERGWTVHHVWQRNYRTYCIRVGTRSREAVPLLSDAGIVENGLVENCVNFVKRHIPDQTVMENGVRRVTKEGFPIEVLREAVVNALVHRDYLLSATDIQLAIFADRLEVRSPGRLPNGITPARMVSGCRAARNQLIKDVMRDYGYLEHMGMGVPRKIVAGMKAFNGTEPQLTEQEESFTVVLRR